jgi:hypothetical protein
MNLSPLFSCSGLAVLCGSVGTVPHAVFASLSCLGPRTCTVCFLNSLILMIRQSSCHFFQKKNYESLFIWDPRYFAIPSAAQ